MNRGERVIWGIGAAGLLLAGLGWILDASRFHAGWLAALALFIGWPLGSMALLLVHSLTGGRWGAALRPALVTGVCALPLLLPALLPLLLGLPDLYAWARPGMHFPNHFYLNVPFFIARIVIYLLVWFGLGGLILRGGVLARIAPAGLFALAITTSFAAIDTTMSLDPHFTSSIYGMINAASMVLLALSMAILLSAGAMAAAQRADLGKLLLALVILWIYLDFMQLLIVWQSDLPKDASWYLVHYRGVWGALRGLTIFGHFILPAALLLSPRMQRSRLVIVAVAGLLVALEMLQSWWMVLPSQGRQIGWIDLACMVGLGAAALGFANRTARRPLAGRVSHV